MEHMKRGDVTISIKGDTSQIEEAVEQAKRVMRDCEVAMLRVQRAASVTAEELKALAEQVEQQGPS